MKKLAVLRSNQDLTCPFGLPITSGCNNIGSSVEHLKIVDKDSEESEQIIAENLEILNDKIEQGLDLSPCPFSKRILKKHVICDLDGEDEDLMPVGSPLYHKPLSGSSFFGAYMSPAGYYNDNSVDRNYQTLYSIENIASDDFEGLQKFADEFYGDAKKLR